jgi:hypothetical protein
MAINPCGGGVEYLHHDPAGRTRRRKGKSQMWDSKIWSPILRDSDPRKTVLARVSSIYTRQPRPLVREGAPQKQYPNCQRAPGARHQDLLTDRNRSDFDFDFDLMTIQLITSCPALLYAGCCPILALWVSKGWSSLSMWFLVHELSTYWEYTCMAMKIFISFSLCQCTVWGQCQEQNVW